jgi:hypothetical protein
VQRNRQTPAVGSPASRRDRIAASLTDSGRSLRVGTSDGGDPEPTLDPVGLRIIDRSAWMFWGRRPYAEVARQAAMLAYMIWRQ